MLEIRERDRHDFEMRSIPGVLFLFGISMWHCSVFPEQAPVVGQPQGGAGGTGTGGAKDGGGGDTGVHTDSQAPATGGGGGTGGASGSGATAGSGGNADAGDAARPDGDAALDGSTQSVSYVANVADCLEAVTNPAEGSCLSYSTLNDGPNELWVDIRRGGRRAFTTYLSFPVDAAIANHTVLSVELRVTVTTHPNAPGTGADVWEVVPFTAASLYVQTPAVVGTAALAETPGAASQGQTVTYSLPLSAVKPSTALYLSLTLPAGGNGTGYWGTNGPTTQQPPTLVITYR